MSNFTRPKNELFFSKKNPLDPRLGELFHFQENSLSQKGFALLGYPDDEGIERNGGRVGAKEGPDQIRHWLYRMTPPPKELSYEDLGNLNPLSLTSLEERHQHAEKKLLQAFKAQKKSITLGGGHDYGYPDGKAFLEAFENSQRKPLVINFDAHLDVRNLQFGITSGTPFFRLRSFSDNFDMIQVGIQNQCNSKEHLKWCQSQNIEVLFLNDFYGKENSLKDIFKEKYHQHLHQGRPTFISVDIDGFSHAYAPGCSQSWPTGVEPRDFFPLFDDLLQSLDVKLLSIYEVSPPLDVQNATSKLAAQIAYRYLEGAYV